MSALAAPRLPRLSASQAQALGMVARHGQDLALELPAAQANAPAVRWQISLLAQPEPAVRASTSICVSLEWSGAQLRLHLARAALSAWASARMPELAGMVLPQALEHAALEALLAELAGALAPRLGAAPALTLTGAPTEADTCAHSWQLRARSGDQEILAILAADDLGLLLLAGALAKIAPAARLEPDPGSVALRLRAELGFTRLPAGQLAGLLAGDVIFFDHYLLGPGGELWLGAHTGQGIRIRAEDSSYVVTQGWSTFMTNPNPAADAGFEPAAAPEAASEQALDAASIPVRLSFDLGELGITLAQLQQLQPGVVFDLLRPLEGATVVIRANGALFGSGSLVEVDGRVGVCIASIGGTATASGLEPNAVIMPAPQPAAALAEGEDGGL